MQLLLVGCQSAFMRVVHDQVCFPFRILADLANRRGFRFCIVHSELHHFGKACYQSTFFSGWFFQNVLAKDSKFDGSID